MTDQWTTDPSFRATLTEASPLGFGVLTELDKAHTPLTAVQNNRIAVKTQQRELTEQATKLGVQHGRMARALFHHLNGFIESAEDPATARGYRDLLNLLFPIGLAVTRLPYIEQSGSAIVLENAVKPAVRAKLAVIGVGDQRLVDLFDRWMAAARELGHVMNERADLAAATARHGSQAELSDVKAGRIQWIRVVRGLLWTLALEPKLAKLRESVGASLQQAIATARRRASQAAAAEGELSEDVELEDVEPDEAELGGESELADHESGFDPVDAYEIDSVTPEPPAATDSA